MHCVAHGSNNRGHGEIWGLVCRQHSWRLVFCSVAVVVHGTVAPCRLTCTFLLMGTCPLTVYLLSGHTSDRQLTCVKDWRLLFLFVQSCRWFVFFQYKSITVCVGSCHSLTFLLSPPFKERDLWMTGNILILEFIISRSCIWITFGYFTFIDASS